MMTDINVNRKQQKAEFFDPAFRNQTFALNLLVKMTIYQATIPFMRVDEINMNIT